MSLIKFYEEVIHSLELQTDKEGNIKLVSDGVELPLTHNSKPLVLPTKEQIDSAIEVAPDGTTKVTKLLYNPLNEDVIKGDSGSLKKTKTIIEIRLTDKFVSLAKLLLILASDKNLQKNTTMEINSFLGMLNSARQVGTKPIVNDKTIDILNKFYTHSLEHTGEKILKIFLKKSGTYDGNKYNRLAVIGFPLMDAILKADKNTPVSGIKLSKTNLGIFNILYQYIFNNIDDNGTISYGSNDNVSPGFISVYTMYLKITHRMNSILKHLKGIDEELYDKVHTETKITITDLETLDIYAADLAMIPSELDQNRQSANTAQAQEIDKPVYVDPTTNTVKTTSTTTVQNEPKSALDVLLGRDTSRELPQPAPYSHATPVSAYAQPQQAAPIGVNSMQVQQPMYQQPMYPQQQQQPMYPQQPQQPMYPQPQVPAGYMVDAYGNLVPAPQQARPMGVNSFQR